MKYCFDLDETICATPSSRKYDEAVPYHKVVNKINELYDQGNEITIFTARGSSSGVDYRDLILRQLSNWGVKFHKLIDKGKPSYDLFVDDKAMSAALWREKEKLQIVGFVASSFDLLHAGHCLYLKEAKSVCDHLIAALQEDPTVDRPHKNKPIQSLFERETQLRSCRYVDEVILYKTEKDLVELLSKIKPNIRILGSDAKGTYITGEEHCTSIYYHNREHSFSSSELRSRVIDKRTI
jgi:glycerol-3-phosphate cytidylyltransferase